MNDQMDVDATPWRVLAQLADEWRALFNRSVDHLEAWQIALYTLSLAFFIAWLRKIAKFEEIGSLKRWYYDVLLNLPLIGHGQRVEQAREAAVKELEERLHRFDRLREFYKFLPDRGVAVDDILREAGTYRTMSDILFERGHLCGSNYGGCPETEDTQQRKLMGKVFELYAYTNAAYPEVYPGCRKMEAEIIRMLCALYHGAAKSCGSVTASGDESILLACLAYRNLAYERGVRKPEMIVGRNAHVAFSKAAKLLGLRTVRVGLDKATMEIDVGAIKRAIGRETCVIVASAPSPLYGNMDPVKEIAQLGARFHVPVHVDASIGGFLLPFMEQCDYPVQEFDFRQSGVTSISVDLDKYAYCPTGPSVVLYRDSTLFYHQCYTNVSWPGGVYTSPTLIGGDRPGLPIALTWALLLYRGRMGFIERTQRILDTARTFYRRLSEEHSDKFRLLAEPLGPVMALASRNPLVPIHQVGDEMNNLGWTMSFLQQPDALLFSIGLRQADSEQLIDELLEDLAQCWEKVLQCNGETGRVSPKKATTMHNISGPFTYSGAVDQLPFAYLDAIYATPTLPDRQTRTLSVEGRKLSLIKASSVALGLASQLETLDEQGAAAATRGRIGSMQRGREGSR